MTFWKRTETKKAKHNADNGKPTTEDRNWENALFAEKLSDEFTDQVMLALEDVEIEPVEEANMPSEPSTRINSNDTSIVAQLKHGHAIKRTFHLKVWGAAAAVVVLVGSTLLFTQPTLAEMVRSLFAKDNYVDNGVKNFQETGLVQISGASAIDQGYILKVNEVIADSTRLIIGIDVYDDKGNVLSGEIDYATADFNINYIRRGNFGDVSFTMKQGGGRTTNRVEFDFSNPVLDDKLQLEVSIKQVSLYEGKLYEGPAIETIKGDWSFVVEADLAKAKAETLLTPIEQSYETAGGIQIEMLGASRTPSGGSLEFTTKLTPEAAERAVDGQSGIHRLNFHLEDEQGNWLGDSIVFEIGNRSKLERWSGVTQWFYQFDNFAYDKQKIRFVLNSYVIRENSGASVTFDPAKISAEHPVTFEDSGDKLLLKGIELGSDSYALILLDGEVNNPINEDIWVVIDENGKEYSVHLSGGISADKTGVKGFANEDASFVIHGLDKMPKQLTLKRITVNRQYNDADWSFFIPQTGTIGVIPE